MPSRNIASLTILAAILISTMLQLFYPAAAVAVHPAAANADENEDTGLLERSKRSVDVSELIVDVQYPMKKKINIKNLNKWERYNLLHVHNAYRSLVRPYAADMVELQWDESIAEYAQNWANNCTATHQENRNLGSWINMGENLYWWYGGRYHEDKAAKFWWDELQFYDMGDKSCDDWNVCGHYITMVWAKSERIGCGVSRCSRLANEPDYGRGAYYFVCLYSGRFVSDIRPYTATDTPCSNCHKTDFPKCRYNLCVNQEMIDKNIGYNGNTDITGLHRLVTRSSKKSDGKYPVAAPAGSSFYAKWLKRTQG